MTLEEYLKTVADSDIKHWQVLRTPTFLYRLQPVRSGPNRSLDFELQEHNYILSYEHDLSISLAWGLVQDKNYTDDWINKFQDKRAQTVLLDFLYNGALVFRETLVAVDGWRCILPMPAAGDSAPPFPISVFKFKLARLIHQLTGPGTNFEDYFRRAGMRPG